VIASTNLIINAIGFFKNIEVSEANEKKLGEEYGNIHEVVKCP
jgi:hypothetical protein